MKVGLVLEHFDPARGGLENWTWQFADRLGKRGYEVHVIACDFAAGGRVVGHEVPGSPSPWKRAEAMEHVLRKLDLDVIHDMGGGWLADIFHPHGGSTLASWEHNLLRIPRWRQFRLWREKRYREQAAIEKRQHKTDGAVIVAVSGMVRDHFQKLHHVEAERIRLIPNGVDAGKFSPDVCRPLRNPLRDRLGIPENAVVFLQVAHNLRLKNTDTALRAFARLADGEPDARLLVIGGRRPDPYRKLAVSLGLRDRVVFGDPVPDVRPYYAAADVLVHPTWYDPCSLVALEALACERPVLTTRFNGVSEMMGDGEEGFLLDDPSDVVALAGRMKRLIEPDLRGCMGRAARRLALRHSLDEQTDAFLALYQEILRKKQGRSRQGV